MHYEHFLNSLISLEANADFWIKHDFTPIPDTLLSRIQELKDCRVIRDEHEHIFDSHKTFQDNVLASTRFMGFSSIFLPSYLKMFLELARKKIQISMIVTSNVFFKIKNEYEGEFEELLSYGNASFHVYNYAKISFVVTDSFFSLSLFSKMGHMTLEAIF